MHPALAIKEKYYGKGHNELAMTLNNLGLVYSKSMVFAPDQNKTFRYPA